MSLLFIVSRDQPQLYDHLIQEFAGEPIQVVLDRRMADRRKSDTPPDIERRSRSRRIHASVDGQLQAIGYAIVHVT